MNSDVPVFGGLKHLPCPKEAGGATCSIGGCLFGHRSGQPSPMQHPQTRTRILGSDGAADQGLEVEEDDRPAQKRQKLDPSSHWQQQVTNSKDKVKKSDEYDPMSPPVVGVEEHPKTTTTSRLATDSTPPTHTSQSHTLPQTELATPHKPAWSTPSEKTKDNTKSTPGGSRSLASALAHCSPARERTSPQPKAQSGTQDKASLAKPQRKPEVLNPRHINSAPAAHGVRHQLLQMLHTELTRLNREVRAMTAKEPELKPLTKSEQGLIWMALDMEEKVAKEKGPIYRNIMGQTVVAHKRMNTATYIAQCKTMNEKKAVDTRLRGAGDTGVQDKKVAPAKAPVSSIGPVVIETGLESREEIELLDRLITPITNLEVHGYVSAPPTEEEMARVAEAVGWSQNWEQCDRCNARFQVFPDGNLETGALTGGGPCTHHPGRAYFPERAPGHTGFINKKYRCCTQELNESPGCATTEQHVWKTSDPKRLAGLWNWEYTPPNDGPDVKKAVAFDCEMGYTVRGMELVRVTATSWPDGAELVDVLVQPFGRILDLNSRYSGVFMEDLVRGVPWTKDWEAPPQKPNERKILRKVDSPKAARDLLFSFISPETVLIGHGLENDLNAMRMIHPRIIDTILLYPHRKGLPIRTSLKALMDMHLRRQIQIDTGNGHDSAEDARAAGDLVRLQVQKTWKSMWSNGWRFVDGALREPGWKRAQTASKSSTVSPDEQLPADGSAATDIEMQPEGGAKLTVETLEVASSQ